MPPDEVEFTHYNQAAHSRPPPPPTIKHLPTLQVELIQNLIIKCTNSNKLKTSTSISHTVNGYADNLTVILLSISDHKMVLANIEQKGSDLRRHILETREVCIHPI